MGAGPGRKARRPGSGGGAPGETKGRDSWRRGWTQSTQARLWGRGPGREAKGRDPWGRGPGRGARHACPALGAGPRGRRQRGGTLGGGAELSSTQVAWTIPSRSGRTSVSAWLRRRPLAEPPSEPRPRPSAGSRPFPSGSTLLAEALSRIFITMPSAPGSSQVIRTVYSPRSSVTPVSLLSQLLCERVRGQPCLLLGLSFSRCLWLLFPRRAVE